jgi:hypothetical protein
MKKKIKIKNDKKEEVVGDVDGVVYNKKYGRVRVINFFSWNADGTCNIRYED